MRLFAWIPFVGVLIATSASALTAQAVLPEAGDGVSSKPVAVVSFRFEHAGLPVPRFIVQIREDGTGRYEAEQNERAATMTSMRGEEAQHVDRTIQLRAATVAKIFKAARESNFFDIACASKAKNIADIGKKTLSYVGADGRGSCAYNFSEDKKVAMLTETFLAVAYTMDEGRKLDFLHRYDRLGLDAEMSMLAQEAEAGRAQELGTISQTFGSIAADTAVMQRVRLRASRLLTDATY